MNTKEFEKQTLEKLLIDLNDIDNYKSFRKGAFVYDLGHYQGQLLLEEINRLKDKVEQLQNRIDKAVEYINKFESIKAYYEYTDEDGYDEYNYDDDFKEDILNILKGKE
jgi:hypothetical protein